jgi:hypothetical protein
LFRNELKYYLNRTDGYLLSKSFDSLLKKDENGNNGQYNVRSLYFDDIRDTGIFEKQSGIFDRQKFRIRHYNNSQDFFKLESKSRLRDLVMKKSTQISKEDVFKIQSGRGNIDFIRDGDEVFNYFRSKSHIELLSPAVIVEYQRSAWRLVGSDFRVTIDEDIVSHLYQKDLLNNRGVGVPMIDEGFRVLELKFYNDFPKFVKDILESLSLQRIALSKYVVCRKLTKFNSWEDQ